MTFSERHGYTEIRTIAQIESMDENLRTALWNDTWSMLYAEQWQFATCGGREVVFRMWVQLGRLADTAPTSHARCSELIKELYLTAEWFVVCDLVELILRTTEGAVRDGMSELYQASFQDHMFGYRIVGGRVTPIADVEEAGEVNSARDAPPTFAAARHHIERALAMLSDREEPDYANSIKESISAVEAMGFALTGRDTFSGAMDVLANTHPELHKKLIQGWKGLYGFTSDEPGLRHAGATAPAVTQAMARYFLITCSAFVNLLVATEA